MKRVVKEIVDQRQKAEIDPEKKVFIGQCYIYHEEDLMTVLY